MLCFCERYKFPADGVEDVSVAQVERLLFQSQKLRGPLGCTAIFLSHAALALLTEAARLNPWIAAWSHVLSCLPSVGQRRSSALRAELETRQHTRQDDKTRHDKARQDNTQDIAICRPEPPTFFAVAARKIMEAPKPGVTIGMSQARFAELYPDCWGSSPGCWTGLRKSVKHPCRHHDKHGWGPWDASKICLLEGTIPECELYEVKASGEEATQARNGAWECVRCYHAEMKRRKMAQCPGAACVATRKKYGCDPLPVRQADPALHQSKKRSSWHGHGQWEDNDALREDTEELLQRQEGVSNELASLRREIKSLRGDVTDCKRDVGDVKHNIKGIKKRGVDQQLARKRPRNELEAQDAEEFSESDSSYSDTAAGDNNDVDYGKAADSSKRLRLKPKQ